ncbi:phospholipase [Pararhizobium mangrovi]|uniref:Phospholipase D n=1 Tax=Pararhizobium mangrovi TaxID=2590452 RepID=A0A506UI44_9HYPH|nr:phospholipase [Pararhizobium mangrovi]
MSPILEPGNTCWRVERANRFAVIIDGQEYYRAVKRAVLNAKRQVVLIGWDFDTRIEIEPDEQTLEGPNRLGAFLNWIAKRRDGLQINILKWNLGLLESLKRGETPLFILRWMVSNNVQLKLDAAHPAAASHHQKIIVIDDKLAFCGGIDITKGRWDTREHLDHDPNRRSGRGKLLGPWHDATTCVDGDAAKALGELARMRWFRGTGEQIEAPEVDEDPWPDMIEPFVRDVDIGIARTMGAFGEYEGVVEIERATLAAIESAERSLYIESQYFASRKIAETMVRRLAEPDGPEIVLLNPRSQDGWLEEKTMGSARAKLLSYVRRQDVHDRFRIFYPVAAKDTPIYVHAKIMVVDDRLLKIGSSNLNNRSMGFDTECDLALEANGEEWLRERIVSVRDSLLGEHLGVSAETVAEHMRETGSLIATIDALNQDGPHLAPLQVRALDPADETLSEMEIVDPIRPPGVRGSFGF